MIEKTKAWHEALGRLGTKPWDRSAAWGNGSDGIITVTC
jgi:hypothetical protein